MIYTLTLSPSIDYFIFSDKDINLTNTNRFEYYNILPGGKGVNASIILSRLKAQNKAIVFTGGITKNLYLDLLEKEKLNLLNFNSQSNVRINVKYFGVRNKFELNGPKIKIDDNQWEKLIIKLNSLTSKDLVMIMGISDNKYILEITNILAKKNIKFILDVDSKIILDLLKFKPLVIKPNVFELENLFDEKIKSVAEIKAKMILLKKQGASNVIVSNGKKGSYLIDVDSNFYEIKLLPFEDKIISTVGCGDTLISSYTNFIINNEKPINAIKKATALSIGTACSHFLANNSDIKKFEKYVIVNKIDK